MVRRIRIDESALDSRGWLDEDLEHAPVGGSEAHVRAEQILLLAAPVSPAAPTYPSESVGRKRAFEVGVSQLRFDSFAVSLVAGSRETATRGTTLSSASWALGERP